MQALLLPNKKKIWLKILPSIYVHLETTFFPL